MNEFSEFENHLKRNISSGLYVLSLYVLREKVMWVLHHLSFYAFSYSTLVV